VYVTGTWTQGLNLEPLHQPYFCEGFSRLGSLELFFWAGFERRGSWSLPPEQLGLQVWATDARPLFVNLLIGSRSHEECTVWAYSMMSTQGQNDLLLRTNPWILNWGLGTAQWLNSCLACARPWVPSLPPPIPKQNKTHLTITKSAVWFLDGYKVFEDSKAWCFGSGKERLPAQVTCAQRAGEDGLGTVQLQELAGVRAPRQAGAVCNWPTSPIADLTTLPMNW
jgi:hypothetical protein